MNDLHKIIIVTERTKLSSKVLLHRFQNSEIIHQCQIRRIYTAAHVTTAYLGFVASFYTEPSFHICHHPFFIENEDILAIRIYSYEFSIILVPRLTKNDKKMPTNS